MLLGLLHSKRPVTKIRLRSPKSSSRRFFFRMDPAEEIPVILNWCSFSIVIYPHDMVLLSIFLGAINSPSTYKFPTHSVKSLLRFFLSFVSFSNPSRLTQSHLLGSCNSSPNWVKVLPFINKQIHQNRLLFFLRGNFQTDSTIFVSSTPKLPRLGQGLGCHLTGIRICQRYCTRRAVDITTIAHDLTGSFETFPHPFFCLGGDTPGGGGLIVMVVFGRLLW